MRCNESSARLKRRAITCSRCREPAFTGKVAPSGEPMDFSTRAVRALLVGVAVASTVIVVQHVSQAQPFDAARRGTQPYTKWDQYGGASDSMQYSARAQINRSNVKQLERAWFYAVPGEPDRLQFNPLIVDNVIY